MADRFPTAEERWPRKGIPTPKRIKPSDIESEYVPLPRNISTAGMELNPKVEVNEK